MSVQTLQDTFCSNIKKRFFKSPTFITSSSRWIRNPSWSSLPSMTSSEQKFYGLVAVYPETLGGENSNFLAFNISGNYTVNWGDGLTENFNSSANAYHIYDFNDTDLENTNAPVTLTDSGDLVQRTAHGYINGMTVEFYNIVSTTGLTEGQTYYVINANANDFQVSDTLNGSAVTLTTNGSATLLPYKQAIVTITPQSGQNLTIINLNIKHNQSGLQKYTSPFLDIKLGSPNLASCTFYVTNISLNSLEAVEIVNKGSVNGANLFRDLRGLKSVKIDMSGITTMSGMFQDCFSLYDLSLLNNTSSVTDMTQAFFNCFSLVSIPMLQTSNVTTFNYAFYACYSLKEIPLLDTKSASVMSVMFGNCYSLTSVPCFNTSSATNMNSMFSGCASLKEVPLFNTKNVTNMTSMFSSCYMLDSIPLFDTRKVTSMNLMFNNCYSLRFVPLLDTGSVLDMGNMFNGCYFLKSIPLFNTSSVTNMSSMFNSCVSLKSIPALNTSNVTNFSSMFSGCNSLSSIPKMNLTKATTTTSIFTNCYTLTSFPMTPPTGAITVNNMFSGCQSLIVPPVFNTSVVTNANSMFSACSSLNSVPSYDFSAISNASNAQIFGTLPSTNSISDIKCTGIKYGHSIANCKLSKTALKKYMDNIGTIGSAGQTLTITNNWGVGSNYTKTVTSTAQSTTVSCADTSSLTTGMMMTGTGTGITTGIDATSDVTADTLTFNNHGLADGTRVSFSSLGTTTGVSTNTIYYVVGSTANTFQVALTAGGAAINLTGTNATMNVRYPSYIQSINTNVSVVLDTPAASSQTNASWIFRTIDSYGALLRGWSVSY